MSELLESGTTCTTVEPMTRALVLVDGENYYTALCEALMQARRYVCMTGWQFDTRANLAPELGKEPVEFLSFLNALCEKNEHLEVFITAWNYSIFYAIEREWFQNVRFAWRGNERIHFRFLNHPEPGAAHHEKVVVIDGVTAFAGGMDVCDERWDSREHLVTDARRLGAGGTHYGPFHDVQIMLTGGVVHALEEVFWQSWIQAGGEASERPRDTARSTSWLPELLTVAEERGLPLRAPFVALSRTRIEDGGRFEIEELLLRAAQSAEAFIYVENQYFTSKAFVRALISRMRDESRSKLDVIVVLPEGGHSKKEELVLGSRQRLMLWLVQELANAHQHRLRVLKSCGVDAEGNRVPTYIHSKITIIDERFVTIGSANLMNRSMRIDHELNVSFDVELCETEQQKQELTDDIRRLRASLLAEHAGTFELAPFMQTDELVTLVEHLCDDPNAKLRAQELERPKNDDPFFTAICDPSEPLDWGAVYDAVDALFDADQSLLKGAARRVGQRLGVVDVEGGPKRATE